MFGITFTPINLQKLPYGKIWAIAATIVCVIAIRQCSLKTVEVTSSGVKIELYKAQATAFSTKANELGEQVNTQLAIITDRDKKVEELISKNSSLRSINSHLAIASTITIPETVAKWEEPQLSIITKSESLSNPMDYIKVGSKFNYENKWVSLSGKVKKVGISFDSICVKDSITINLGISRKPGIKGWFQSGDPKVELINSNPYMKTNTIQNITFKHVDKWYDSKAIWLVSGIVSGVAATIYLKH